MQRQVTRPSIRSAARAVVLGAAVAAALAAAPIDLLHAQAPAPPPTGVAPGTGVPAASPVDTPDAPPGTPPGSPQSLMQVVFSGGMTGFLIVLFLLALSVGAAALVIEHLLTLREPVLAPPGLGERVRGQLTSGSLAVAQQACQAEPSLLSFVIQAGLSEADGGWPAVEKALEDATAEQAARLMRKVELLSVIGNIAPMVGLLGTVMGMIFAFQEVASTQGAARAADLAEGIYTALVTTVGGLLVAIPSLAAFALFRNRLDQLVAEAAYAAQHAVAPIKRARRAPPAGQAPAPPPAPG